MNWSKKGAKDNRARLVRTRYFKYILNHKEYFFKEKVYLTHCDGWTEAETIKKQTYKNATKRGNECIEVIAEKDIMSASLDCLGLIFSEKYGISECDTRGSILKVKEIIEKIKKDSTMGAATEYAVFKRILNWHIDLIKDGKAI